MHETVRRLIDAARTVRPEIKTVADLARALNQSEQTINNWSYRGNGVSKQGRLLAQKNLGISATWIEDGRGAMLSGAAAGISNVERAELGSRKIPVISYVQAGLMVEVVDPFSLGGGFEIIEVSMPCSERTFALRIRGNSMEPRFYEGDLAIIDPELNPKPGQFVVAKNTSEEATFKKYRPRGLDERGNEVFELVPLNDDYPTLHSERDHLHIIGVCIERRENMLR